MTMHFCPHKDRKIFFTESDQYRILINLCINPGCREVKTYVLLEPEEQVPAGFPRYPFGEIREEFAKHMIERAIIFYADKSPKPPKPTLATI